MEKWVELATGDGHVIYGTWNGSGRESSRLIVFVHGLTGSQFQHHYFNAAPFFAAKGFDTFRFDLYSEEEKGRKLSECSLGTHVGDLARVVDHFKGEYQELFLVGHSFGVPVILATGLEAAAKIVLWDPTTGIGSPEDRGMYYVGELGKYVWPKATEILISEEMVKDWKAAADLGAQVEKITKPCKFIFAGEERIKDEWKQFVEMVKAPHESVVIEGATHNFDEEGTERKLFEETLEWLE